MSDSDQKLSPPPPLIPNGFPASNAIKKVTYKITKSHILSNTYTCTLK